MHSRMGAAWRALSIVALLALAPRSARAQVSTDIIRGRITDTEQKPVAGAEVKATSYAGQVSKTATTDKSGRFTIIFINGEGDYWMNVRKLGLQAKRFEIKKIGDEEVMIADARMASAIVALDAVTIREQATRALPDRSSKEPDVGGGARPLGNNPVSPDQEGNLAAMAAAAGFQLIPGLNGAPDMYSVLGLSGDQNNVTFNGLGSGISALPPDVLATTSINPYPFDVSRGGFSGAQIAVQTIPGSNFSRRLVTNVSTAPQLEWADQPSAAQGDRYSSLRIGGNAAGPFKVDQIFYNSAYNVARRLQNASTLTDASPTGLIAAGVAPDSVTRLLNVLGTQQLPTSVGGLPSDQTQEVAQGLFNMDVMPSASGAGHSFTWGSRAIATHAAGRPHESVAGDARARRRDDVLGRERVGGAHELLLVRRAHEDDARLRRPGDDVESIRASARGDRVGSVGAAGRGDVATVAVVRGERADDGDGEPDGADHESVELVQSRQRSYDSSHVESEPRHVSQRCRTESARDLSIQLARGSGGRHARELHAYADEHDAIGRTGGRRALAGRLLAADAGRAGAVRRAGRWKPVLRAADGEPGGAVDVRRAERSTADRRVREPARWGAVGVRGGPRRRWRTSRARRVRRGR